MSSLRIELKNVKLNRQLSEETPCFTATVYISGKQAGRVQNSGHGGQNRYQGFSASNWERFTSEAKRRFPSESFEVEDLLTAQLLDDYELTRWLKRQCKTKTL
jgi:hypothetical protein